jgi:ComF family protein
MSEKEIVNKWLKIIQQILSLDLSFPCYCVLCLQSSQRDFALCQECESNLPWLRHACPHCGLSLADENGICWQCHHTPFAFDSLQALFHYQWPVHAFVGDLKYKGHLHFVKMLANLMANHLWTLHPIDCVIGVPLHPVRQRQRGFNQTIELAKIVSKLCQLPFDRWGCTKTLDLPAQATLSQTMRKKSVSPKAFAIAPTFVAKHVLVIEDVVTTGQTIQAFTQALKMHGVSTVEIWSVCRTSL